MQVFKLGVSYNTIAIVQPNEDLNDWNDIHVQQGFSWRPTSVSFATLSDEPDCEVNIVLSQSIEVLDDAVRVIVVPFTVGVSGIEVDGIIDSKPISIPEGEYEVVFSAVPARDNTELERYVFHFVKSNSPVARIIKADTELSPPSTLLMEANPAR